MLFFVGRITQTNIVSNFEYKDMHTISDQQTSQYSIPITRIIVAGDLQLWYELPATNLSLPSHTMRNGVRGRQTRFSTRSLGLFETRNWSF